MIFPTPRRYSITTAVFAAVLVVSWWCYQTALSETVATLVVLLIAVYCAWRRPSWLMYLSIGELIVGGKGYLFFLTLNDTRVSVRMILFSILIIRGAIPVIREWRTLRTSVLSTPLLVFSAWLCVSVVTAITRHIPLGSIATDANAFIYLAALPVWWLYIRKDPNWQQNVLLLLLAGATAIGILSWILVLLFAHNISSIQETYTWIRNSGMGEVTYINNNIYRVFLQSQIYAVLVGILLLNDWIRERSRRWTIVPLLFSGLGTYISLSRSFWLGAGVAALISLALLMVQKKWHAYRRLWVLIPVALFSWAMMVWAISWPSFHIGGSSTAFTSRISGTNSLNAATARKNQIQPLLTSIARHPVWGSGFGQTVTYFSTDPTVRGWRTTAAFELGYLDLWLKVGLVGLALYFVWVIRIWQRLRTFVLGWPMILASVALFALHATTPYLNHPLGLGWIMITALYAYDTA